MLITYTRGKLRPKEVKSLTQALAECCFLPLLLIFTSVIPVEALSGIGVLLIHFNEPCRETGALSRTLSSSDFSDICPLVLRCYTNWAFS